MNYNEYAKSINKIFENIFKMKNAWPNPNNLSNIEEIEKYRDIIIKRSSELQSKLNKTPSMEELGQ